jgi:hypothetical protein
MIRVFLTLFMFALAGHALAQPESVEHFTAGEFRGGLSWDNISAMEMGVYRFGATAGIYIKNGLELGVEQQFIVKDFADAQSRTWSYARFVPFRAWALSPYVSARMGYFARPDKDAFAFGGGAGLVYFLDRHFAFEFSIFGQRIYDFTAVKSFESEFDCRFVGFF